MYSKTFLTKLSAVLNVPVDTLEVAAKSAEEFNPEVPELFKKDEVDTLSKNRFNEGKLAASEILVKDLKKKHGIESATKDPDEFLNAFAEKVKGEVSKDPTEREKKLETDLQKLRDLHKSDTERLTQEAANLTSRLFQEKIGNEVLGLIPATVVIPREDVLTLFRTKYEVAEDNGQRVVKRAGEILKNTLREPLKLAEVVTSFLDESRLIPAGGPSTGDKGGGGTTSFKTTDDVMKHLAEKGIEPMSAEGLKILGEARKSADFKM